MKIINPAFDYDRKRHNYLSVRRSDPRLFTYITSGLHGMKTVINVGAGIGSYEPEDKYVVAVEPSANMRNKRLEVGRNPAINSFAESLPFDNESFDASLAVLTIHHWQDIEKGLTELKRVTRKRIVILTFDPYKLDVFWNIEYFPLVVEVERNRYPAINLIKNIIGHTPRITNIKIPFDCTDGFQEAYYGRPEYLLKKEVRQSQSAWSFISKALESRYVANLQKELSNGEWERKYGYHRHMKEFEGAYRMIEFDL